MIGTVRKHQTWLWAVIIVVTIISFVVFFSPQAKIGGGPDYNFGSINGKAITRDQMGEARRETLLYFRMSSREWPTEQIMRMMGFDMERETYNRLLLVEKLQELKIHPSDEATAKMISDIFGATGGAFPMDAYNQFINDIEQHGLSKADFERFVRHEVGRQQLVSTFGLSGKLITEQEAKEIYLRENEVAHADAVFFNASNFLSQVSVNETNLQRFFEQNMAQYRIPERVQVKYVEFPASNFRKEADEQLAKMTNMNSITAQVYDRKGGTNFYKNDKGQGLTLDQAAPRIKEEIRDEVALGQARKHAADFINDVFNAVETNKNDKATLEKLAAAKNLKVKETEPFTMQSGPANVNAPNFARAAFSLTAEDPYTSSPVEDRNAVYVLGLTKRIPSENPPLAKVRAEVVQDYKQNEARKLARAAGEKFATAAEKALSDGKNFKDIATQQKAKVVSLPEFSASTRSLPELHEISLDRLQNIAGRVPVGKASDFVATEEGGAVVFIRSKTPPAEAKIKAELPEFVNRLREQRQYAAYGQWAQNLPAEMNLVVPSQNAPKQ